MNRKRNNIFIGIVAILVLLVGIGFLLQQQASQRVSKEELAKRMATLSTHMKKEYKQIKKEDGHVFTILEIDAYLEDAKQTMLKVQDEALYVGKFVCKVNTCQTNPDDENYQTFLVVTDKLVMAKKDVVQLQKKREAIQCYDKDEKEMKSLKQQAEKLQKTN